jgi:hypothetical protein
MKAVQVFCRLNGQHVFAHRKKLLVPSCRLPELADLLSCKEMEILKLYSIVPAESIKIIIVSTVSLAVCSNRLFFFSRDFYFSYI